MTSTATPVVVNVQKRGVIAIPPALRRKYHLDEPGSHVSIHEIDGDLVLRPMVSIPASQAWFWTEEWQAGEREADEDIAAGRVTTYSPQEFVEHLRQISAELEGEGK